MHSFAQFTYTLATFNAAPIGEVIEAGTLYMGNSLVAPATHPYYTHDRYWGGTTGTHVYGQGNIINYDGASTLSFHDSSTNSDNNIKWVKVADNILMCDRNLLGNISRNQILTSVTNNNITIDNINCQLGLIPSRQYGWDVYLQNLVDTIGATAENGYLDDVIHWQGMNSWVNAQTFSSGNYYYAGQATVVGVEYQTGYDGFLGHTVQLASTGVVNGYPNQYLSSGYSKAPDAVEETLGYRPILILNS